MKKVFFAVAILLFGATAQAKILDLYTLDSSGTVNGGIFQQTTNQPTGTGVIDSFVRIQQTGTEEGFNTGYRSPTPPFKAPLDDLSDPNFTRNLLLSEIPVVTIGGTAYRQFLLDINEVMSGTNKYLSLNSLQIFLSSTASLGTLTGLTAIYSLDVGADGDSTVNLDAALGSGSGSGDMFAYVPDALFGSDNPFVYLYSKFGNPNASSDGFEEWAVIKEGTVPVPEPGTVLLLGFGFFAAALYSRRRQV